MNYSATKPSLILSQYIKQYWEINGCLANGEKFVQRIIPNGLMEVFFYFDSRPTSSDKEKNFCATSLISGQQKDFYDITLKGRYSIFSVQLQPFAAKLFFNLPSNELYNKVIPLEDILRQDTSELEESLYSCKNFMQRVKLVEAFLLTLLKKKQTEYKVARIMSSIRKINSSRGLLNINDLANDACLSRKQFERTFNEYVGDSPKRFLRVVRFQNSLYEKHCNSNVSLTELAYKCGFYDQAHMINEYKLLSGITPSQFFDECTPTSDYFE